MGYRGERRAEQKRKVRIHEPKPWEGGGCRIAEGDQRVTGDLLVGILPERKSSRSRLIQDVNVK